MDHMSSLDGASGAYHAIPYCGVVGWQYDGLGFSRLPQSKGINIDHLRQGDMYGMAAVEMNLSLQAWLFFRLLHSVCPSQSAALRAGSRAKRDGTRDDPYQV